MTIKYMAGQSFISLNRNNVVQTFLFLFPKQGYTPANLQKTIQMLVIGYDDFTFDVVGYIRIIVNASRNETSSRH